jgi:prepilin-type N-terminal cleavage/methylation domain-containing protein
MPRARGFTLIEISVALVIGALVLAIAAPALSRLNDRVRFNTRLQALEDGIAALPRLAYATGEEGSLRDLAERHLDIPAGWSLAGAEKIFIKRNGLCAGGALQIIAGQSERQLELAPPFCTVKERS